MRYCSVFLLILVVLWSSAAAALTVESARFGQHPDSTRLVLELSGTANFRAFQLTDPSRIVIDLPAFDWQVGTILKPLGTAVTGVRTGLLEPGISRIVVDLSRPSVVTNAFLLPRATGYKDRLVIDFRAAGASDLAAHKDTIFGTLDTQRPLSTAQPVPQKSWARPAPSGGSAVPKPSSIPDAKKPLIIIDAGHGGQDPGAMGANKAREKNVTLAAAKALKDRLESTGRYRVHLTRDRDVFIKLHERVKIGRRQGGDLFISLHADSIDKPAVRGASVYTLSNTASDAQTAKLAARENKVDLIGGVDLSHEDKEVADILIDLAMRDTMNQSKFLANTVVEQFKHGGVRLLERPHRYAGFAVLKAPDVPSILIEMGFMSNRHEADMLSTPNYRNKIVQSVTNAVDAYFAKVQKNNTR